MYCYREDLVSQIFDSACPLFRACRCSRMAVKNVFSWKLAHVRLLSYVLLPSLLGLTFSNTHLSHIHRMACFPWPNFLFFPTIDPDFSSALAKHSCHSHIILMPLLERSQKPYYFACVPCLLYFLPSFHSPIDLSTYTHTFSFTVKTRS